MDSNYRTWSAFASYFNDATANYDVVRKHHYEICSEQLIGVYKPVDHER